MYDTEDRPTTQAREAKEARPYSAPDLLAAEFMFYQSSLWDRLKAAVFFRPRRSAQELVMMHAENVQLLAEIYGLIGKMRRDQREIDRLRRETRQILDRLDVA